MSKKSKNQQKIAFIGQKGFPAGTGGVERHVEALASRIAAHKQFKVAAYCRAWYSQRSKVKGSAYAKASAGKQLSKVGRIFVPSIRTKHLDAITHTFLSTLHALFIWRADIIHYHGVGPALLAFIPRLVKPRVKVIVTFHCIDRKHGKWGASARWFLRLGEWCATHLAHETIAVSQTLQQYVRDVYDREARYIPNGVDSSERPQREGSILARFGLEHGSYILAVARLVPHKRISDLIVAWQKLKLDKQLVIVGGGSFTDNYLHELSVLIGHDERISLLGEQPNRIVRALLRHCAVFVQPSVSEGLPIIVLEALAEGALVLASDIPEHEELIQQGKYGLDFTAGSISELARGLERVTRLSPAERKSFRRAGQNLVRRAYDWDRIADSTVQVYEDIQPDQRLAVRVAYQAQ